LGTFTFIAIILFSGAISGALLGLINQSMVEPFIDKAIGIETQKQVNADKIIDFAQQSQYRRSLSFNQYCYHNRIQKLKSKQN